MEGQAASLWSPLYSLSYGWLLSKEIKAILAGLNKRLPSKLRPLLVQSKKVPQALKFMILPRVRELAMPALCVVSRKMHTWVPAAQMSEMLGVAHGAGVPYEQIFLLNILPTLIEFPDPESLIEGALGCTNAVLRNKGLVHGRNLDWGFLKEVLAKHGVMFRISPGSGQALLSLGYPGIIGVFSALNEAGLSFGWESVPAPKDSSIQGSSVLLRLRDVAQRATSLKQAVRLLKRGKGTLGYHFTIADGRHAAVLEVSARNVLERRLKADLLLGCDPTRPPHAQLPSATASGKGRYNRLKQTLPGQPARAETMLRLLSDPRGQVRNGETIHQVVMMPATRTMWVRAGDLKGPAVAFSLEGPVESLEPKPTSRPSVPKRPIKPKPMPRSVAPYKAPPDLKPSRSLFRVKREPFQVTKTLLRSFPLKSYRVEFPSPFKSPHACNNTVYGFYYVPRRKAKGAVVLLPIWKGPDITFEKAVASYLVLMGFKVFIMPHAYQFERSPKGVRSGDYTISADLVRTRNAFIQTVQDARRAATWLQRDEGVKNLAVMGISLGGVMSSLVYSVDDRFKACSVILGGGDLGGLLLNSDETRKIRRSRAARQATVKQVRHALRAIEPLTYATKARGTGVMMINGTKDTSVPPANAKKLAAAFGVQPHWIPVGHYDGWTYILRMLRLSAQHMQERFLGASQK